MGIYDRDYYRDEAKSSWGDGAAVKYLIIANVVVFLLQIFVVREVRMPLEDWEGFGIRKEHVVQEWFELKPRKVLEGQVWRLVTCAFCHDTHNLLHIVFNMLLLFWFGQTLEVMYGSREFLCFYFTAAIVSSLAFLGLQLYLGRDVPAIGASGAVMGVMMLYTWHFPKSILYVFYIVPLEMRWAMLLYAIYDLHPVLMELASRKPQWTGIAHSAHLGGLAFGFLYAKYEWRIYPFLDFSFFKRGFRRRPRLRIAPETLPFPRSEPVDDRVDEILEKISRVGKENLTEEELNILKQASERLRERREHF